MVSSGWPCFVPKLSSMGSTDASDTGLAAGVIHDEYKMEVPVSFDSYSVYKIEMMLTMWMKWVRTVPDGELG